MEIKIRENNNQGFVYLDELKNDLKLNQIICTYYNSKIFIIKFKKYDLEFNRNIYECVSLDTQTTILKSGTIKEIIKYLINNDYEIHIFNNYHDFLEWALNNNFKEINN